MNMETPLNGKEANVGLSDSNGGLDWECGEDNDGWYVGPPGEQRAWAASEQDALMITFCMNASIEIRRRAIEEAIVAVEESQPPETTPWNCVDAIRKKCKVSNVKLSGKRQKRHCKPR